MGEITQGRRNVAVTNIVGSGEYTYEMEADWAKVPEGWSMPAAAVFGDSEDRVYAFNRDPEHPVCVFGKDGDFLWSWGQGLINFAHAILIDKEQNVWLVDRNTHEVHKYTKEGAHLMTIGRRVCVPILAPIPRTTVPPLLKR